MIGYLEGKVLQSGQKEIILLTKEGIGYQVIFGEMLQRGAQAEIYISHILREQSQELYGFLSYHQKKLFELLLGVKGVGPKSAYALCFGLGAKTIFDAIRFENKKILTQVPGIGPKAAAQILLDLGNKLESLQLIVADDESSGTTTSSREQRPAGDISKHYNDLFNEVIMGCKELGYKEKDVIPLTHKILKDNQISRAEQVIPIILREMLNS